MADPRDHLRLPARGRVGAADARRPGRLPAAGGDDGLVRPGQERLRARSARCSRSAGSSASCSAGTTPDTGLGSRVPTLRDRLPADLREARPVPGSDDLPFSPLYLTEDEWALEIANRTVHGVLHLGWVSDDGGGYRGQMAVLVKPTGLLRDRLHGRDHAVPPLDRVPGDAARDRAGVAGARRRPYAFARNSRTVLRNASENDGNGWITSSITLERHARADRQRGLLEPLAGLRARARRRRSAARRRRRAS